MHPGCAPNPLYIPLRNLLDGSLFYFQPTTLDISGDVPLTALPYGGILSEELGSGKTCIILGMYNDDNISN